ncbi:MAG: hypothetical protein Q8N08_00845 [Methanobacteriaceae archaeon]|nr:hypothetical protein [Methanobacteriaceae archaeon]
MDIEKYFNGFKDFLETDKGLEWEKERKERKKLYWEKCHTTRLRKCKFKDSNIGYNAISRGIISPLFT